MHRGATLQCNSQQVASRVGLELGRRAFLVATPRQSEWRRVCSPIATNSTCDAETVSLRPLSCCPRRHPRWLAGARWPLHARCSPAHPISRPFIPIAWDDGVFSTGCEPPRRLPTSPARTAPKLLHRAPGRRWVARNRNERASRLQIKMPLPNMPPLTPRCGIVCTSSPAGRLTCRWGQPWCSRVPALQVDAGGEWTDEAALALARSQAWEPTREAIDVFVAVHAATGLPWWGVFGGVALLGRLLAAPLQAVVRESNALRHPGSQASAVPVTPTVAHIALPP